jgi:hypothetical protein
LKRRRKSGPKSQQKSQARSGPRKRGKANRDEARGNANRGNASHDSQPFRMFLVPCSCGTTFAVADNYDRQGTAWSRYLTCPGCAKRHDPKNRLLQMGFHPEGYWKVDQC